MNLDPFSYIHLSDEEIKDVGKRALLGQLAIGATTSPTEEQQKVCRTARSCIKCEGMVSGSSITSTLEIDESKMPEEMVRKYNGLIELTEQNAEKIFIRDIELLIQDKFESLTAQELLGEAIKEDLFSGGGSQ